MTNPEIVAQATATTFFTDMAARVKPEWVAMVRHYIRDYAEKNPLLGNKQEFSDEDIRMGILDALSYMDSAPPSAVRIAQQGQQVPLDMFLGLTSISLLKMALHQKMRNSLNYSDGGVSIDTDRFDKYERLITRLQATYDRQLLEFKKTINARQARGSVPSGFWLTFIVL